MSASCPPSLFPLFADLCGRRALVVGGGMVARRKTRALLAAGARVRVGAPALEPALARLAASGEIEHLAGAFRDTWLDDAWLVIAATDDRAVNRDVAAAAHQRRLWINVVDDRSLSSVQLPALVRRGPLQIAISSGGGAPMLARHLREWLESQLDTSWGALATLFLHERERIRARLPQPAQRRAWFARLLRSQLPGLLRSERPQAAARAFERALQAPDAVAAHGSVVLVGAGPGDPGLLTLHALRALNEADVIVHDRLVGAEVLALARRDAELVDVGKAPGAHVSSQDRINAILLAEASAGRQVVRLKGGDPFVFGRGGEELEFLRAHGIAYRVVPGITAAIACAAYAGVPLTHRDHARSLRLLSAHCRESQDAFDWAALASDLVTDPRQTLAVYMGVAELERLQSRLLAHGVRSTLPFALVEHGSLPGQRVIAGTLAGLAGLARQHAVAAPALLILGEVAALASRLHWYGAAPLGAGDAMPAGEPLARAT